MTDKNLTRLGIISDDGEPCSVTAFVIKEMKAVIKWLYTKADKQGMGAATMLMDTSMSLLDDPEIDGIETFFDGSVEALPGFLSDYGFLVGKDTDMYSVPVSDLVFSPEMDELLEKEFRGVSVTPLSNGAVINEVMKYISETGFDPDALGDFSPEYSFAGVDDDGNVRGCIIVSEDDDMDLIVSYLAFDNSLNVAMGLVTALAGKILEEERTEGTLRFTAGNDSVISLVEMITRAERDEYRIDEIQHGIMLF